LNNVVRTGFAAALCLWTAVHAVERVGAFHSDIRIASSGEVSVTETIELQAAGRDLRRGIEREFPGDYRDRFGHRMSVPIVVEKVTRNGAPEPYRLERVSNGTRVRTGAAGSALPLGKHVYQIVYRTARQIGFYDEHDELYWDVARGLNVAIDRLSAEVSFERPVPAERMKLEAQTGAHGARGQDYHAFVREGSAAFRSTRPLAPGEGMSIVVAFPKGVVAQPSLIERGAWHVVSNHGVGVGIGVLALMLAFLLVCWRRYGRVPSAAPRAAPPAGVGPGGVRFIDRKVCDERCVSAALLGLQNRGYLRIREHGERLRVERTGSDVEWFPGEQALARRVLRDEHAELRRRGRTLEEAGRKFSDELHQTFGRRSRTRHGSFALAAAGIGLAGVLAMLALDTPRLAMTLVTGAMALTLAVFSLKLLPVYHARGREHLEDIEALRQYLSSAEPTTEEEFARLLPYAVALELEKVWGKHFAETVPSIVVELTPPASGKARARPRRPARHTRSAAA
jgi:Predicted membrane protein (DUF2207)